MSDNTSENSKRIAKNTLLLYMRMLLLMGVNLYTSRVVLQVLGVTDFGIYNVVGGFVAMFSVISASLSAAISRFLTYELGRGDKTRLSKIFSSSVTIQIGLAIIILLLAETVGMWYLNGKMNIPEDRMYASNCVFQLSLATFVVNLINVPYNSAIIAHEKMGAFAYISIFEGLAKLGIAFLLFVSPIDKLVYYSLLMFMVAFIVRCLYTYYCTHNFEECKYKFVFDKELLRQMFGFAGWNIIGASAGILRDQGGNLVLNYFLGTIVNAARGISFQIKTAVQSFSINFMMALNPQITKSYARGDKDYMMMLLFRGARYSYYILLILTLPIFINTPYILNLWLTEVPDYTVNFTRLVLILTLSESLSNPLITAMLATGKIRYYQIIVGGLNLLNLPVFILLLKAGIEPESVFVTEIIFSQICLIVRLVLLKNMIGLKIVKFLKEVYFNIVIVTLISALLPFGMYYIMNYNFSMFCIVTIISILSAACSIWVVGFNYHERKIYREKLLLFIKNKIKK